MTYRGTVIEESLLDNRLLNDFKINKVRISNAEKPEDRWHLYEVEATPEQIDMLATQLKPTGWYTHFWRSDDVIVVFPNEKFEIQYSDQSTWQDAIAYGESIGIPTEQLDFKIDEYENKMKNALILHGTDASPFHNWFTWLKEQLEQDGYDVWLPQLPDSATPSTKTYNEFLLSNPNFVFNDETILIGHSSGAVEILSLLQHLPDDVHIKAAYFASAFKDDLGWDSLTGLFEEPFDFEKIKARAGKFVFLHSDNDPYVPLEQARYLSEQVEGELIVKTGQGHFNTELSEQYREFPLLFHIIEGGEQ